MSHTRPSLSEASPTSRRTPRAMSHINYLADIISALDDLQSDYRVNSSDCNLSGLRVTVSMDLSPLHSRAQDLESLAARLCLPRMAAPSTVHSARAFAPPAPKRATRRRSRARAGPEVETGPSPLTTRASSLVPLPSPSSWPGYAGHPYGMTLTAPGLVGAPAVPAGYLTGYSSMGVPFPMASPILRPFTANPSASGSDQPLDLSLPLSLPTYHTLASTYDPTLMPLAYDRSTLHLAPLSGYGRNTRYTTATATLGSVTTTTAHSERHVGHSRGTFYPPVEASSARISHTPLTESDSRHVLVTRHPRATPLPLVTPLPLSTPPPRQTPSPPVAEPLIPEDDPGLGGAFMGFPTTSAGDSPPSPTPGIGEYSIFTLV